MLSCLVACVAVGSEQRPEKLEPPRSVQELEKARAAETEYFARRDRDGWTVLHRACERGAVEVVRRMLELGADAKQSGDRGVTPLHATMSGAFSDALTRSMKPRDSAGEWSAEKARAKERETRGQAHAERGPMQFADVARLLLAKGADADAKMQDGMTPLYIAASAGRDDLASILIEARVDVNAFAKPRGQVAATPLVAAAASADLETVRVLLDAGAHPAKVPEESRGYFVNVAMSSMEVFRLLLDSGLELPPDAMKIAARRKNAEAIKEIKRRQRAQPGKPQMDQEALDEAVFAAVKSDRGLGDARRLASIPCSLYWTPAHRPAPPMARAKRWCMQ